MLPLAFLDLSSFFSLSFFISGTDSVTQGFWGRQTEIAIPASVLLSQVKLLNLFSQHLFIRQINTCQQMLYARPQVLNPSKPLFSHPNHGYIVIDGGQINTTRRLGVWFMTTFAPKNVGSPPPPSFPHSYPCQSFRASSPESLLL